MPHADHFLSNYFDRVVLINLTRRPDRLAQALSAMRRAHWPFRWPLIFEGIDGRLVPAAEFWTHGAGAWGCTRSHQLVLEQAIQHQARNVLILEDDLCFADDFAGKVEQFLRRVPSDWDGLMLGGQHINLNRQPSTVTGGVVRCTDCERGHCYAVRGNYMRKLYQRLIGGGCYDGNAINDWIMGRDPELQLAHRVYAPSRFLVGQERNFSDLNLRWHPRSRWNPPGPDSVVVHLRSSASVAHALRAHGFYFGSPQTAGRLAGLLRAERSPRGTRLSRLREWITAVQWELAGDDGLIPVVWHPRLRSELVRQASLWPVVEIRARTVAQVLRQLPETWRRRIRPLPSSAWPGPEPGRLPAAGTGASRRLTGRAPR